MIINRLVINNFKNYHGPVEFDFSISDSKNMVVIGGYNGAGKTTMTEAIRLCLYGQMMNGSPMSDAKYQQYLKGVKNRQSSEDSFSITMDVELTNSEPHKQYQIMRKFHWKGAAYEESLELRKDNEPVELITQNYWNYYVEKLIPPATSKYFFFDGENIRNVIASDGAHEYLESAINDLSGISELNMLEKDLNDVRKRIVSKSVSKTSNDKIKAMEAEIDSLKERNSELIQKIEGINNLLIPINASKADMEKRIKHAIGVDAERYNSRKKKLDQLNKDKSEADAIVADFMHNKLPFLISNKVLEDTVRAAKEENKTTINSNIRDYLNKVRDSKLLNEVVNEESVDAIIDKMLGNLDCSNNNKTILDISLQQIARLERLEVRDAEVTVFLDTFRRKWEIAEEIDECEKLLSSSEDSSVAPLQKQLDEIVVELKKNKDKIDDYTKLIEYNNKNITEISKKIREEEKKTLLSDLDKEMIKNIDQIFENISERIVTIKRDSVAILIDKINDIYFRLKNKSSMVKTIRINDEMFIEIIDFNGESIDIRTISEGEKGILMYSIIHGLHSLSGGDMPLIIDSPLGKMDSLHTNNLIRNYYPIASEQVIILSHDREITKEVMDDMDDLVSHKYLIRSEEEPKLIAGYFE